MLRSLLKVPNLSVFGLSALKGQAAETEKDMWDLCRRVLERNLVLEVDRRLGLAEESVSAALGGLAVEDPGGDFALGPQVRAALTPDGLFAHAFILDANGSLYDETQRPVWPAAARRATPAGGDSVALFEELEDEADRGEELAEAIARARDLIDRADSSARPQGLIVLARMLLRAGRDGEAIAAYDRVCREFPTALDSLGVPLGPAAAYRRLELRLAAPPETSAEQGALVDGIVEFRRILLLARHQMDDERYSWEQGRLRSATESAAEHLPIVHRSVLSHEIERLDRKERALLTVRRLFGDRLARIARGTDEGGRMSEVVPAGPRAVYAIALGNGAGARTGVVVFEIDLGRIRHGVLPELLAGLPLPDGVGASVLDGEGRPVVAGPPPPPGEPLLAVGQFGEGLSFWRPVAFLRDPGILERRTAKTRNFHYGIMVLSIAGILAAGWFVLRTVKSELAVAKLKSDFLSTVTHELKTPLTSIRMFVEMLEQGRVKDEVERAEALGVISRESERLSELIQRVLDLARFEGRREDAISRSETDLGRLMAETAKIFRLRTGESEVELTVDVDPAAGTVVIDGGAAQELLLNLLANAMKYGGKNIRLSATEKKGAAVLVVEDNGIGIDEREQARIFEKFYRSNDSLTRAVEGSGLGLALVREIALAHGGRVDVESDKGEGSRFTVTLPTERNT